MRWVKFPNIKYLLNLIWLQGIWFTKFNPKRFSPFLNFDFKNAKYTLHFLYFSVLPCDYIQVTEEANNVCQSYIIEKMKGVVYGSGKDSWYKNSDGQNYTLWPNHCIDYWWKTLRVNSKDFITSWCN